MYTARELAGKNQLGTYSVAGRSHSLIYVDRLGTLGVINIYAVNGFYIRGTAEPEFTNFAEHYRFPHLIPIDEFWIDLPAAKDKTELDFYIENMETEWVASYNGLSFDKAERLAEKKETAMREKYSRLPVGQGLAVDPRLRYLKRDRYGIPIYLVNGDLVRNEAYDNFTEGGHDLVYKFIADFGSPQLWIDDQSIPKEIPNFILHESNQRNLMSQGMKYPQAHARSSQLEFSKRQHDMGRW